MARNGASNLANGIHIGHNLTVCRIPNIRLVSNQLAKLLKLSDDARTLIRLHEWIEKITYTQFGLL